MDTQSVLDLLQLEEFMGAGEIHYPQEKLYERNKARYN